MLTRLQLRHFRCFETLDCDGLGAGMTVFIGDNAQGKTSILEAICVLLRLQSPRTNTLAEGIQFEQRSFALEGDFGDNQLIFGYSQSNRRLTVDGERQSRAADYLRHSGRVVWFANDDLELIRGGGERRRRYLDFLGMQLDPAYREALRAYDKALRSRNYLLKQPVAPEAQLEAYAKVMLEHGAVIMGRRTALVTALSPRARAEQERIGGSDAHLQLIYEPGAGDDFEKSLAESRAEERRRKQTLVGPHRDDVAITIGGRPASSFASEGQQRTIALALKLAQAGCLVERFEEWPLLLLDDIFGELDVARRNALMQGLPADAQLFVTTTHLDWLDKSARRPQIYTVHQGTASRCADL